MSTDNSKEQTMEKPFFHERDFCSREDIDYAYLLSLNGFQTGNAITLEELLEKYKQYLVEQGELVSLDDMIIEKAYSKGMDTMFRARIKELEKEVQHYRDQYQPTDTNVGQSGGKP